MASLASIPPVDGTARPALLSSVEDSRVGVQGDDVVAGLGQPRAEETVPAPDVEHPVARRREPRQEPVEVDVDVPRPLGAAHGGTITAGRVSATRPPPDRPPGAP